jgi:uncharacterized protein (TIGR00255 family)
MRTIEIQCDCRLLLLTATANCQLPTDMKSMTGFGRGSVTGENFTVSVDLKTVNNRFLDISLRVGADLAAYETAIKRQISSRLARGRVDVIITFERTDQINYELNRPMIAGFVSAMRAMQEEFNLHGEPDMNVIARIPGALQPVKDNLSKDMVSGIEKAIDIALTELEQMREKEGAALVKEMLIHLKEIERHVPVIEDASEDLTDIYRARLHKRINELLTREGQSIELDQGRLSQEAAYLADRSDISEEIARLKSHVAQFREIIEHNEKEAGKRLDFLLQELNREANTILSKANEINIKESALVIKTAVEKLREQVQNVE